MHGNQLIFASLIYPGQDAQINGLLLAESIRAFAGGLSHVPVWFVYLETSEPLSASFKDRLNALEVDLFPVRVKPETMSFPLACDPVAAAHAEALAVEHRGLLAWLGANTVVLREPLDFLLPDALDIGVRPVHHKLIGSRIDQPTDPFWKWVYDVCHVPAEHIFPMTTHVDAAIIRPYINAGSLAIKPELGLLSNWCELFLDLYQSDFLKDYYERDWRYKVFIHQALLTGTVLSAIPSDQIKILPGTYNYPLHLYGEDISGQRPSSLEELVTFRHEGFYKDPDWRRQIPASTRLVSWLAARLPEEI